jgi:hypothetical protein
MESAPEQQKNVNYAEKTRQTAESLYPMETWIPLETGMFAAKQRLDKANAGKGERHKLDQERAQARYLTMMGSIVYFLHAKG